MLSEVFPPRVGGSGRWLHDIYSRLPVDDSVLLVGQHPEASAHDDASALSIERMVIEDRRWTLMNPVGLLAYIRMLIGTLRTYRRYRCTQIHCARVLPEGVVGLVVKHVLGARLVCFVHGEDVEIARFSREQRWLVERVIGAADRLVCNSSNSRSLLREHWNTSSDRMVVLRPGIDTNRFRPSTDRERVRAELGWNDKHVILTLSRLDARKGHDRMIAAMPRVLERVPDAFYAIVGDGLNANALKAQVAALGLEGRVHFYGGCSDDALVEFCQSCDLFVLPNRQIGGNMEGFGIVLLEAQACGAPVIAGASGGTSETMVEGRTGFLVDCEPHDTLVDPICHLLEDDEIRLRMGREARRLMVERFSWSVVNRVAERVVFL